MSLYVTEYRGIAHGENGGMIQAGQEPALANQKITIGATSAQSAAFNEYTYFVRLHCESACHIVFGTDPTATTSTARLSAGQTEFFGVPAGQSYKVAVIQT